MPKQNHQLFLHEEILLLALGDDKGTIIAGPMYVHAMGGAILAELFLSKRITVEAGKKHALVARVAGEIAIVTLGGQECPRELVAGLREFSDGFGLFAFVIHERNVPTTGDVDGRCKLTEKKPVRVAMCSAKRHDLQDPTALDQG